MLMADNDGVGAEGRQGSMGRSGALTQNWGGSSVAPHLGAVQPFFASPSRSSYHFTSAAAAFSLSVTRLNMLMQ